MTTPKEILTRTKAGRRFMGFMRILNKGDQSEIRTLAQTTITEEALAAHNADIWGAQLLYIHAITGGLRVVNVLGDDEYRVVVLMQANKDERLHIIDMAVEEEYPHRVAQFIQRVANNDADQS